MTKSEVEVGGVYAAKVAGRRVRVRVDEIIDSPIRKRGSSFHVTNLNTGRKLVFKTAGRFSPLPNSNTGETAMPKLIDKLDRIPKPPVQTAPHLLIIARAGTGKTTTLVEGLKLLKGGTSPFTPSPQQEEIWRSMALSKGAASVCFVAFNKSIATELQARVPAGCEAMTMHSMGNRAVANRFGRLYIPRQAEWVVRERIAKLVGRDVKELMKDRYEFVEATRKLVSLCKMNLVDGEDREAVIRLANHYDVDTNGSESEILDLVPRVLEVCKYPRGEDADGRMDFDDMIWLPVVHGMALTKYDLLLVDEAQDLNRCQQALAKMAGDRLIFCGDPKQALYGFAGADSESMTRLETELRETGRGVDVLPLTVTRRCGKAIVDKARDVVGDFEAHESNPAGLVKDSHLTDSGYRAEVRDGDMVICRVNAPLVSECFRFLKSGRKANIIGRDVGAGLLSTIRKLNAEDVVELSSKLEAWFHRETEKENARRLVSEAKLIALQDRYDCLVCFIDGAETVAEVEERIERVFVDKSTTGIRLSSIHKAKGLEADRVFLLQPKGATIPHPMAKTPWQREQEWNCWYVAVTRAIHELTFVSDQVV